MKLGIICNYAPANFEIAAKRNLDFVEFCCNNDEDTNRFIGNVPAIIEESKRTGIPVGSVGRWNSMPNLGADGLDTNVVELIKRNIDAAHAVGSEVFVATITTEYRFSVITKTQFVILASLLSTQSSTT